MCDRCGSTKEVERRRLEFPDRGRRFSFDACEDCRHALSLAEWEALMPRSPRSTVGQMVVSEAVVKQATRGRSQRRRVVKR